MKTWWALRKKGTKDQLVPNDEDYICLYETEDDALVDADWIEGARPREHWIIEPFRVRLEVVE